MKLVIGYTTSLIMILPFQWLSLFEGCILPNIAYCFSMKTSLCLLDRKKKEQNLAASYFTLASNCVFVVLRLLPFIVV